MQFILGGLEMDIISAWTVGSLALMSVLTRLFACIKQFTTQIKRSIPAIRIIKFSLQSIGALRQIRSMASRIGSHSKRHSKTGAFSRYIDPLIVISEHSSNATINKVV